MRQQAAEESSRGEQRRIRRGRLFAVFGMTAYSAPMFGGAFFVIGMMNAMETLSHRAASNVGELTAQIGSMLTAIFIALPIGLLGMILLLLALKKYRYQALWTFWGVAILSLFWVLFIFPWGAIPAGMTLFIFVRDLPLMRLASSR